MIIYFPKCCFFSVLTEEKYEKQQVLHIVFKRQTLLPFFYSTMCTKFLVL